MQQMHPSPEFPHILEPQDISIMRGAVATAVERLEVESIDADKEAIARIVFRFYRSGLVDPLKLATVALRFSHPKLFAKRQSENVK